jgi:hypothetical protein
MRTTQRTWHPDTGWSDPLPRGDASAQLLLAFGPVASPPDAWFADVRAAYPAAHLVYASGGGQIAGTHVRDDATVLSALHFREVAVRAIVAEGAADMASDALGARLGAQLRDLPQLKHVLAFTDGLVINGDAFVRGLAGALPEGVGVSGGLASDGLEFVRTTVGLDGPPAPGRVVAVGLGGASLVVGAGTASGWGAFGPDRVVTASSGTVVRELDDERALDVYRRYLGSFASELPGSALLFPLAMRTPGQDEPVVRTILGLDEAEGSLRFAGEVPEGAVVRLMRADTDGLLDGAAQAAARARRPSQGAAFALCVSCVGRRAVLRSRVDEELDEVQGSLAGAVLAGFYSNGEIAPIAPGEDELPVLHNQTMTVTTLAEA